MKGRYLVYILLSFSCLFPFSVNAECDYQRKAELSRIASNVQFSYNYETNYGGGAFFKVFVTNLTSDIYIKDDRENNFPLVGESELSYLSGDSIKYEIYSNDNNCKDEIILTKYISLPIYNSFYSSPECQEHPDFKYCQKWSEYSIDTEKFEKEYSKYVNNLSVQDPTSESEKLSDILKAVFNEYKVLIITGMVFLLIVIIVYILRKYKLLSKIRR